LRARKRAVIRREDLEINGAAVLFGHDLLDRTQYDTLGVVTGVLQRIARAWGGRDGSVNGLWSGRQYWLQRAARVSCPPR
jgi:hypothetical protein